MSHGVCHPQETVSYQTQQLATRETSISGLESKCRELGLQAEQQQHRLEHFEVRPNKAYVAVNTGRFISITGSSSINGVSMTVCKYGLQRDGRMLA